MLVLRRYPVFNRRLAHGGLRHHSTQLTGRMASLYNDAPAGAGRQYLVPFTHEQLDEQRPLRLIKM